MKKISRWLKFAILTITLLTITHSVAFWIGKTRGFDYAFEKIKNRIENNHVCFDGEIWYCWANMDRCSYATTLHEACISRIMP